MNSATVYQAPKSDKTFIKTEYYPTTDGVATEFQCSDLFEVKELLFATQKATLAMGYLSIFQIFCVTFKAIFQHIKQKLQMVFSQSF